MKFIHSLILLPVLLTAGCASKPVVFDMDSLAKKNFTEIAAVLGESDSDGGPTPLAQTMTPNNGRAKWTRPDAHLVLHYRLNTGNVEYLELFSTSNATNQPTEVSEKDLLDMGNLNRNSSEYNLLFQPESSASDKRNSVELWPKHQ